MKKFDQINVIPFIDIMLVLLAIVLMTASFISQGKINVQIPEAETIDKVGADDISGYYITVTADGTYYLNDRIADLPILVDNVRHWSPDQPITLKIDARAPFDHFVKIGQLLQKNQLNNVQVITTDIKP